ncbi:E3 ubiquitin ligase RBR family [Trema orientale]|uniref:RBR-type E3 ubiquitin transferase n=1 Tax=Trema orientale TaxID=63057 RepID=A0A2P5DYB9_TREOI|nr:E3 ubiquitin ligase RBR family [Trema orientale]
MAGSSSSSSDNIAFNPLVDDFYFSALFDDEEIFPISDEKYAHELQLQEALISATSSSTFPIKEEKANSCINAMPLIMAGDRLKKKVKLERGHETSSQPDGFYLCPICLDAKPKGEMFRNDSCSHSFCSDCIGKYVVSKIQENISMVKCPGPRCGGVLEPQLCCSIVPAEVFVRWENALCESFLLGSGKIYCPFKDCLAMLVDDGDELVTTSECPNCHRLFCARCNVPWHEGTECGKYDTRVIKSERTKEEKMVMELAKNKDWRRCPGVGMNFAMAVEPNGLQAIHVLKHEDN